MESDQKVTRESGRVTAQTAAMGAWAALTVACAGYGIVVYRAGSREFPTAPWTEKFKIGFRAMRPPILARLWFVALFPSALLIAIIVFLFGLLIADNGEIIFGVFFALFFVALAIVAVVGIVHWVATGG